MKIKKTFYIFLSFVLLLIISIALFDYYVLNKKIITVSNDIRAIRKKSETIKSRLIYVSSMKKEEERITIERQRLKTVRSFSDALEFLNFLEESAGSSGNQIKVTIQEGKIQLFNVQLSGSFNSLINFLIRLEDIPAEIQLNHIISDKTPFFISKEGNTAVSNEVKSIRTEIIITPLQALPSIL